MTTENQGGMVKVWSWNPGGGASSREVPIELVDEVRSEFRALGMITWLTGSIPVRAD